MHIRDLPLDHADIADYVTQFASTSSSTEGSHFELTIDGNAGHPSVYVDIPEGNLEPGKEFEFVTRVGKGDAMPSPVHVTIVQDDGTGNYVTLWQTNVQLLQDVTFSAEAVSDQPLRVYYERAAPGSKIILQMGTYVTFDYVQGDVIAMDCNNEDFSNDYRFGFNGQMKDNKLKGVGNSLDFSFRIHDARLGRFLSLDPLAESYPWNSKYAFAENRPIDGIDLEGREWDFYLLKFINSGSELQLVPYDRLDAKLETIFGTKFDFNNTAIGLGSGSLIYGTDDKWHEVPEEWANKSLNNIGNPKEIFAKVNSWEIRDDVEDALIISNSLQRIGQKAEMGMVFANIFDATRNFGRFKGLFRTTQYVPQGAMRGKRIGHTFEKHGSHNTYRLQQEAKNTGQKLGQWTNDAAAEKFIADHLDELKNGAKSIDLPEGMGRIVNPDGTFSPATKARLVPSGSGVKTAFPEN